jgi:hypothetical protein
MIYSLLLTVLLSVPSSNAQTGNVASIVMMRGHEVTVYSGGKKLLVDNKQLPVQLSPGDEVQLGLDSDCELVFGNKDSMYAGAETLFSVDVYRNDMNSIWIKYGSLLYRGENAAAIKASDLSVVSKKGDFLIRYKRSAPEAIVLNFGQNILVKQGDDEEPYILKPNNYVKAISFKNKKKTYGMINPEKIQGINDIFRIAYIPNEKETLPSQTNSDYDKTGNISPSVKKANIDFLKRTIGL